MNTDNDSGLDGLKELVSAVDGRIKQDALYAEVKKNLLFWHETNRKSRLFSAKVRNNEELTDEESAEYQDLVYSAMEHQSAQIERLIASGVIKDGREFGLACQKVSNMVFDNLSKDGGV